MKQQQKSSHVKPVYGGRRSLIVCVGIQVCVCGGMPAVCMPSQTGTILPDGDSTMHAFTVHEKRKKHTTKIKNNHYETQKGVTLSMLHVSYTNIHAFTHMYMRGPHRKTEKTKSKREGINKKLSNCCRVVRAREILSATQGK